MIIGVLPIEVAALVVLGAEGDPLGIELLLEVRVQHFNSLVMKFVPWRGSCSPSQAQMLLV